MLKQFVTTTQFKVSMWNNTLFSLPCCSHEAVVQCIWRATRVCRPPHIRPPCATTFHLPAVCRDSRHKIQNFPMSMNLVDQLSVFPVSTCVIPRRQLPPTQQEGKQQKCSTQICLTLFLSTKPQTWRKQTWLTFSKLVFVIADFYCISNQGYELCLSEVPNHLLNLSWVDTPDLRCFIRGKNILIWNTSPDNFKMLLPLKTVFYNESLWVKSSLGVV